MARMTDDLLKPLLVITDAAREKVMEVRANEPDPDALALWLEVSGLSGNSYTYDMYFRRLDEAGADDAVQPHDDLPVVVPAESVDKIRGATLDVSGGGMVLDNPNTPSPTMGGPKGDVSGPVAQKVIQVLDQQVNPSIAAHGGHAELVAVEDDVAYLRLGGGCVGCGMASVTLTQGIEVAIFEAVPEIHSVVDVTDHASGTNPYYEAAKK